MNDVLEWTLLFQGEHELKAGPAKLPDIGHWGETGSFRI